MGKDDFIKIIKEEDSKDFMIDKIRDKDKFVRLNNSLYFLTEFDEYEENLETDQPYFRV